MPQLLIMAGRFVAEKVMKKIGKKLIEKTMDMAKDFTENVSKTKDNVDSGKIIDGFKDATKKGFEAVVSSIGSKLGISQKLSNDSKDNSFVSSIGSKLYMNPKPSNDGKDNDEDQEKTKAKEKNKTLSPEEERNKNGIQETIDNVQNPINLFADFFKTLKEGLEIAANKIKEKFIDDKKTQEQGQDQTSSKTLGLNS
jgi:hypothetical protein